MGRAPPELRVSKRLVLLYQHAKGVAGWAAVIEQERLVVFVGTLYHQVAGLIEAVGGGKVALRYQLGVVGLGVAPVRPGDI